MTPDPQSRQDAKRIVLDFFDLAFVKREAAQAAERYLGTEYKQHNPLAPDGPEAFVSFIGVFLKQTPQGVPCSGRRPWPQRDSNPCYRLERAAS